MTNRNYNIAATCRRAAVWLLATLCVSMPATAQPSLTQHSAEYRVKISVLGGRLNTELRRTETGYVATHVIRATGLSKLVARGTISETSWFDAADDGVRPTNYRSEDTLSSEETRTEVSFNWETGEAKGTVNGANVVSQLDDLAHDRVSIQYELMHDLLNDGPSGQYTLFDVDELKAVNVRNIGRKSVKVPAGRFEAIGIQQQSENSSRTITLWCVEELDYLPVIIEQHRRGKLRVRAVLEKYQPSKT